MSARDYHDESGYERHSLGGHYLDWGNQPSVLKHYHDLERFPLPAVTSWPEASVSELLAAHVPSPSRLIDTTDLARVLTLAHSVTATTRQGGMEFHFRNVASAGALYPFELYVAGAGLKGVKDGLYHHGIVPQQLTLLRRGNLLGEIRAAVNEPSLPAAGLVFFLTAIFFRSAWKYRDRSYRYDLLDTGHLLESLVLALKSAGLSCLVQYDFDDAGVNALLGVDPSREVCLAVVSVNLVQEGAGGIDATPEPLSENAAEASRTAQHETDYPRVRRVHAVSSEIVLSGRPALSMEEHLGLEPSAWEPFPEPSPRQETISYADAVRRRRSSRNFVKHSLGRDYLDALVDAICAGNRQSVPAAADSGSVGVGFLTESVEGLDSGWYLIDRQRRQTRQVRRGSFIKAMAEVCLGQGWLANCALQLIFVTNVDALETRWGPRGYRYALLSAGRLGQRIYLTATAMRLGCCGIGAFFDREASALLGLGEGSRLLYLMGVGHLRKWSLP
ncbi:MAG: SagB/ThcOx family dehydrogenase [Thermodesulfobacteriota bacterium]